MGPYRKHWFILIAVVAVIQFTDGRISGERIYWDQASVLAQVGLLDATSLPITGPEAMRKAEEILESDPPLIPIAYEQIYDAWYDKVHGQNPATYFGIYDVVRWDNVWVS